MKLIDLTPLALSLIALLGLIITVKVVPLLKEKFTSTQLETIFGWVEIAVKCAEQLCKDGRFDPAGRKQYVIDYVTALLLEYGFTIEIDKIEKMIEAIVLELPKTFEDDVEIIEKEEEEEEQTE